MAPMTTTKRLIKAVEADIDARIAEAKAGGADALDLMMMDKLLKSWSVAMEVNKMAETDPHAFLESTFWVMSVISVEAILNTTPKDQPDQVYAKMNEMMTSLAGNITKILEASVPQPNKH